MYLPRMEFLINRTSAWLKSTRPKALMATVEVLVGSLDSSTMHLNGTCGVGHLMKAIKKQLVGTSQHGLDSMTAF